MRDVFISSEDLLNTGENVVNIFKGIPGGVYVYKYR